MCGAQMWALKGRVTQISGAVFHIFFLTFENLLNLGKEITPHHHHHHHHKKYYQGRSVT
jgi:hypothetical protein